MDSIDFFNLATAIVSCKNEEIDTWVWLLKYADY